MPITPESLLNKRIIKYVDDKDSDSELSLYLDNGTRVVIEAILPPGQSEPVIMVWDGTNRKDVSIDDN